MKPQHAAWIGLLLLAGCGSSPKTHFFTLQPQAPAQPAHVLHGKPIEVGHVVLPAALDRTSLVESGGGERLVISDQNQWASPLAGMIQQVLASDLKDRLNGTVLAPGDPAPRGGVRTVSVNVRDFISDTAGHVTLKADWSLLSGNPAKPSGTHSETVEVQAASEKPEAVTAAMSRALAELSDRIAAVIGR